MSQFLRVINTEFIISVFLKSNLYFLKRVAILDLESEKSRLCKTENNLKLEKNGSETQKLAL